MSDVVNVTIHASQFPDAVRRDLLESLRTRRVNHKFHYDSVRQTQKWLALHQAHSPSRNDADCAATYDRAFAGATAQIEAGHVHLIGLGCGGGQKDARLLCQLRERGIETGYTACDVSTAMVLVARETVLKALPNEQCFPFVCDLATADDLPEMFEGWSPLGAARLITFFGMIPNFEPEMILPKLANLVRPGDSLLFSANLAPGNDYAAGVQRVLPQYDNPLTRDWLETFLLDLGVERNDGETRFTIEAGRGAPTRIVARFEFTRARRIEVDGETFNFKAGDACQLFFSYRYTPELVRRFLGKYELDVKEQWITKSEEEGVFFCQRR